MFSYLVCVMIFVTSLALLGIFWDPSKERTRSKYEELMSCGHEYRYLTSSSPTTSDCICAICELDRLRLFLDQQSNRSNTAAREWMDKRFEGHMDGDYRNFDFDDEIVVQLLAEYVTEHPVPMYCIHSMYVRNCLSCNRRERDALLSRIRPLHSDPKQEPKIEVSDQE